MRGSALRRRRVDVYVRRTASSSADSNGPPCRRATRHELGRADGYGWRTSNRDVGQQA